MLTNKKHSLKRVRKQERNIMESLLLTELSQSICGKNLEEIKEDMNGKRYYLSKIYKAASEGGITKKTITNWYSEKTKPNPESTDIICYCILSEWFEDYNRISESTIQGVHLTEIKKLFSKNEKKLDGFETNFKYYQEYEKVTELIKEAKQNVIEKANQKSIEIPDDIDKHHNWYFELVEKINDANNSIQKTPVSENIESSDNDVIENEEEDIPLQLESSKAHGQSHLKVLYGILIFLISSLFVLAFFAKDILSVKPYKLNPDEETWPFIIHIVVIPVLLFWHYLQGIKVFSQANNIVKRTLSQFIFGWRLLWMMWFILYIWFWHTMENDNSTHENIEVIIHIFSSTIFFYLFLVLDKPSVNTVAHRNRNTNFKYWLVGIIALAVIVASVNICTRYYKETHLYGELATGVFSGLCICFFLGRLDSHFLGKTDKRRFFLGLLYCYPLIQVLWIVIRTSSQEINGLIDSFEGLSDTSKTELKSLNNLNSSNLAKIVFTIAFGLKFLLFMFIQIMLENGNIESYISKMHKEFTSKNSD